MNIFIYIGITLFVGLLMTFIGHRMHKIKSSKILKRGTGRFGIIKYSHYSTEFIIEIEEIEKAGNMTKVKMVDISIPCGSSYGSTELLSSCSFKEWIKTDHIIWYDDNSQRIRDNKISEILN